MPQIDDDVPELGDPSHDAPRGDLARLFIAHKSDIGAASFPDDEIVAHVDDIAWQLWWRVARASSAGDLAFFERYAWLVEAFQRLYVGEPAAPLDG